MTHLHSAQTCIHHAVPQYVYIWKVLFPDLRTPVCWSCQAVQICTKTFLLSWQRFGNTTFLMVSFHFPLTHSSSLSLLSALLPFLSWLRTVWKVEENSQDPRPSQCQPHWPSPSLCTHPCYCCCCYFCCCLCEWVGCLLCFLCFAAVAVVCFVPVWSKEMKWLCSKKRMREDREWKERRNCREDNRTRKEKKQERIWLLKKNTWQFVKRGSTKIRACRNYCCHCANGHTIYP